MLLSTKEEIGAHSLYRKLTTAFIHQQVNNPLLKSSRSINSGHVRKSDVWLVSYLLLLGIVAAASAALQALLAVSLARRWLDASKSNRSHRCFSFLLIAS